MGFIHQRHCDAIKAVGGEVIATVDIDKTKNPTFLSHEEMLKSPLADEADAFIIATPNHTHKEIAVACLKKGKPVLMEKPCIIDSDFTGLEDTNHVLQLRYHKLVPEIKKALTNAIVPKDNIDLIFKVYRDNKWWSSWRGDEEKSGGILMGLAIHVFDLLIFLLGNEYEIAKSDKSTKLCTGTIAFPTALVNYHVEVMDNNKGQTRSLVINGETFELCDKDNLSFAGYHDQVYKHFIAGNGIPLSEARKSIELILKL